MRKSWPQMGQRTFEESFASWHTCIGDLLSCFYFCRYRKQPRTVIQRWDCCFGCREIMTTLEMSLGGLEGPARRVFRANFGDPVQLGSRTRSIGCAEEVWSPPCSREW